MSATSVADLFQEIGPEALAVAGEDLPDSDGSVKTSLFRQGVPKWRELQ